MGTWHSNKIPKIIFLICVPTFANYTFTNYKISTQYIQPYLSTLIKEHVYLCVCYMMFHVLLYLSQKFSFFILLNN